MSGAGGVDAQIPLAAGRIGQGGGNTLAAPGALMDTLTKIQQMQLFPGQLQRQQQEIQQGGIGIQKGQLDLTNAQNAAAYGHLTPLLQNPDPQLKDVTNAYGVAAGPSGLNVDRQVADAVKTFPVGGTTEERRAWVAARVSQSGISPENRVLLNTPAAGPDINTGQQTVPTTRGALLGATPNQVQMPGGRPGAPIAVVPSVSDLATPYHYTGSDGREVNTTKGQYAIDTGVNPASLGFAAGASVPPPPSKGSAATGGARKDMSGPPPGTVEAAQGTAKDMATMGSALVTRGDQAPINRANYASMMSDLSRIGTMGPGTDREKAINALAIKATGHGLTMTPEQVAAADSFGKLSNIIVGQQLASIGGTDARQQLFMGASPHLDLSKLGNEQILHMLQGNEDAIQAKSRAWQKWIAPTSQGGMGMSSGSYGQFQDDFNHHFDPRVFQQQYMGKSEIEDLKKYFADKPGELERFKADTTYAREHKMIP